MPNYDYSCSSCSHEWEVTKPMSSPAPRACPRCGQEAVVRLFSCPSITYANRPPWTYNDCRKYKDCRLDDGPRTNIDPGRHGDLGSWNSPGEVVPLRKGEKPVRKRRGRG